MINYLHTVHITLWKKQTAKNYSLTYVSTEALLKKLAEQKPKHKRSSGNKGRNIATTSTEYEMLQNMKSNSYESDIPIEKNKEIETITFDTNRKVIVEITAQCNGQTNTMVS